MKFLLLVLIAFPLGVSAQDQMIFLENFRDNRWEWPLFDHEKATGKFNYGQYELEHRRESGSWGIFKELPLEISKPWRMKVEMGHLKGISNMGYSFVFGRRENSYYQIALTGNGYFFIGQTIDGVHKDLLDWVEKPDIIRGSGLLNEIIIEQSASGWQFFINETLVHQMKTMTLAGTTIGFSVTGQQSMSIGSIEIWQSDSPIKPVAGVPIDLSRENLGRNVNTEWYEKIPVISPDGKTLYFTRDDYPLNVDPEQDDIWYSVLINNEWSPSVRMKYPLNQDFNNSVISVTPDNNSLMLLNRYAPLGGSTGTGLSLSVKSDTGWAMPKDVVIDNYYNNSAYTESNLSANQQVILITLNREDTQNAADKDGRDIYVCFRQDDGKYSEPRSLGPQINTTEDEVSPFLAADNRTLYFSSEGWPGYGSADVFVSHRLDETWSHWSEPENLGMGINTASWDAYFSIPASGEYGYLVSANASIGGGDVFRIALPPALLPEPVVLVSGKVYDSKSEKVIGADIQYNDISTGEQLGIASSDPRDGKYQIVLPVGTQYSFRGEKDGYYPVSENLDVRTLASYTEIAKDLYLTPLEVGQTVRINNIFFEFNDSNLKQESFEELSLLVKVLNENPSFQIELGGHTDSKGAEAYNMNLSQERANSVRSYLVSKGIAQERLVSKGYGEQKPVADNSTADGQALNRRVEFTILK